MEVDLKKEHVFLGMPTHRNIHPRTCLSLLDTQAAFLDFGIPHVISVVYGDSLPHHARSLMLADFMESTCSIMAWCDSDIVWKWQDFFRMCVLAKLRGCVVGAYPSRDGKNRFTINVGGQDTVKSDDHGLIKIDGTGMGFSFIRRDILTKLSGAAELATFATASKPVPYVFRTDLDRVREMPDARGEDIAFFADIRAAGYDVFLNPEVTLGHIGEVTHYGRALDLLKPVGKAKSDKTD